MVSRRLFSSRIEFLIEESSVEDVARFYGRNPQTVRRWASGSQAPSQAVRTSVSRRALDRGAARADQVRVRGRFSEEGTVATRGSIRAVQSVNRNLRRQRLAEIRAARRSGDERRIRMAQDLPSRLTQTQEADLALRRERLIDRDEGRTDEDFVEYEELYDLYDFDDWEAWRNSYQEMVG